MDDFPEGPTQEAAWAGVGVFQPTSKSFLSNHAPKLSQLFGYQVVLQDLA